MGDLATRDDERHCSNCGRPLAGDELEGETPCLPETSPGCWSLIYRDEQLCGGTTPYPDQEERP